MLEIPSPVLVQIRNHAEAAYPDECCGILIGMADGALRKVVEMRRASNLNLERSQDRYLIDPKDQLAAEKEARRMDLHVIGYYHSHPDHPARASATDSSQSWENLSYFIVSVLNGAALDEACFTRQPQQSELVSEEWKSTP